MNLPSTGIEMTKRKLAPVARHLIFRGDRLRWVREQLGKTQEEMNALLGFGAGQISRYETGESEPLPKQLAQMVKILDVTSDWLLGLTDNPEGRFHAADLSRDEQLLITQYRAEKFVELAVELLKEEMIRKAKT